MAPLHARSRLRISIATGVVTALLAACSGDDGATTPTVAPQTTPSSTEPTALTTTSVAGGATTVATSTVPPGAGSTTTTMPPSAPPTTPVPLPTGAPGVDSADAFCRDYARVLATANLLGVATAFVAHPPEELVRIEVIASPAQLAAAAVIGDEIPASAADEVTALTGDVVGPLVARAAEIDDALVAAGLDEAGRAALVAAWDDVLATDDPGDPAVVVGDLAPEVAAVVDAAAAAVTPTLVGYLEDPRTIVDASVVPGVQQYVTASCPEILGLLGDAD